jgi:hypothetical protein
MGSIISLCMNAANRLSSETERKLKKQKTEKQNQYVLLILLTYPKE